MSLAAGAASAPAAEQRLQQLDDMLAHARVCIQQAQARMQQYENRQRRDVRFAVGDLVRLSAAHINLKGVRSRKLGPKFLGPFKVLAAVGEVAYRLQLPATMQVHNVFHVSQLQPWHTDKEFPQHMAHAQPGPVAGSDEYEVESILDVCPPSANSKKREWFFLVRWKGWAPEDDTWEPASNIYSRAVIDAFWAARGDAALETRWLASKAAAMPRE